MRTVYAPIASLLAAALLAVALLAGTAGPASAGDMMPMPVKTGDANMDGQLNSLDALQLMFYDAGLVPMPPYDELVHTTADVDCDGVLNSIDASLILQAVAGLYQIRP